MNKGIRTTASAVSAILLAAAAQTATAGDRAWEIELTPYLWAAGINADVTVRNQSASVDASFSDIVDALDVGGAFLLRAQRGPWVVWTQVDYLSLSSDELDDAPAVGTLGQDVTMATLGFGRNFESTNGRRSVDVLLGARYLDVDTDLRLNGIGTFGQDRDATDPLIIIRPSFQLSERWRFNPTFSYGTGGDSEKVWEMQPQLQFTTTERTALRFGYRKLHYELESENGNVFDGAFEGPFLGFSGVFGGGD